MNPSSYSSKRDAILTRCEGTKVLHLGCVGSNNQSVEARVSAAPNALHVALSDRAEVTGVDISADAVEELRRRDICTNILVGDVEELGAVALDDEYDWIVIGDLIEHLSNPGRMLDGVRRLCSAKTRVILTTPHAFGLAPFLRHVAGRFREPEEHVMTFNAQNLANLVRRHGFSVEESGTCYQTESERKTLTFRAGRKFFEWFPKFGGTLIMILSADD